MNIKYTLRQSRQSDFDFLYELNKVTMKDHVVQTWGKWDDEWQTNYLKDKFKTMDYQIILVDDKAVGTLKVVDENDKLDIELIEVLPEFQGFGIGTAILQNLMLESEKKSKSLCLSVLKSNERAKKLYEKQGFSVANENKERYFMTYEGVPSKYIT